MAEPLPWKVEEPPAPKPEEKKDMILCMQVFVPVRTVIMYLFMTVHGLLLQKRL